MGASVQRHFLYFFQENICILIHCFPNGLFFSNGPRLFLISQVPNSPFATFDSGNGFALKMVKVVPWNFYDTHMHHQAFRPSLGI